MIAAHKHRRHHFHSHLLCYHRSLLSSSSSALRWRHHTHSHKLTCTHHALVDLSSKLMNELKLMSSAITRKRFGVVRSAESFWWNEDGDGDDVRHAASSVFAVGHHIAFWMLSLLYVNWITCYWGVCDIDDVILNRLSGNVCGCNPGTAAVQSDALIIHMNRKYSDFTFKKEKSWKLLSKMYIFSI